MTETVWSVGQRAIVNGKPCTRRPNANVYPEGDRWWRDSGGTISDFDVESVYPLLTLDPDNEKQMDALYQAWWSHSFGGGASRFAAAVRSMLPAPPVPTTPEPNGRGAYVEDTNGQGWRRLQHAGGWSDNSGHHVNADWADVPKPIKRVIHGFDCSCSGPGCTS